jgi:2-amino-4-hydroxy-6-hydroxymethyldihydropteridine diphosphokinase
VERQEVVAYIGLGSNLGDSKGTLLDSWHALGEVEGITLDGLSSPYMTAPVGMTSNHWFTNAVGRLRVTLTPLELLQSLLSVEASFGRLRGERSFGYQDRSLDLDLLYYGDVTMDKPDLILPHPRIGERLFVLVPLAELEPGFFDIFRGESIATMEERLRQQVDALSNREQEIARSSWDE